MHIKSPVTFVLVIYNYFCGISASLESCTGSEGWLDDICRIRSASRIKLPSWLRGTHLYLLVYWSIAAPCNEGKPGVLNLQSSIGQWAIIVLIWKKYNCIIVVLYPFVLLFEVLHVYLNFNTHTHTQSFSSLLPISISGLPWPVVPPSVTPGCLPVYLPD